MIWLFLLALWVDILDTHWKVVVIFQEFLLFETSFFPDFYLSLEKMGHKNVTKHINWQFFLWVDVLGTHWKVAFCYLKAQLIWNWSAFVYCWQLTEENFSSTFFAGFKQIKYKKITSTFQWVSKISTYKKTLAKCFA